MLAVLLLLAIVECALAARTGLLPRQQFTGTATFNIFGPSGSGPTVCGPISGSNGAFAAAAGDLSPSISGGVCSGSVDMSLCAGSTPISGYVGPSCPYSNCGTCYQVTNLGGYGGGQIGGVGNSVTVQIVDSCPASNAWNFCKQGIPDDQRCVSSSTNQLDIDQAAYQALTGQPWGSGPNLMIGISPAACP